jgi:hypothetical protein
MSEGDQKPPTGEQIPSVVGDSRAGWFQITSKTTLGAGNFGSVFAGVSRADPSLSVAIKFETAHAG